MIAIIDYGMGNIHSVQKALESLGAETIVTNKPRDIKNCRKLVLPGVGAFGDAMKELRRQGLIPVIKDCIADKKAFLGICLGMQLLFENSAESVRNKGLGVLRGKVKRFVAGKTHKVPHMGWNQAKVVSCKSQVTSNECPLLKGVPDNAYVYFCHSYYPVPKEKGDVAAITDYGINFASAVWRENVYGVQFHPEKSQKTGLKILENFIKLC